MYKYLGLLLPLFALIAVNAACGSDSKTTKIPGVGEVSTSNKVPDGFPNDFPIYGGAKVTTSSKVTTAGNSGFFVNWETGDAVDKVKEFYSGEFEKGPWKSTSNIDSNGTTLFGAQNTNTKKSATLTLTRAGDKTTIAVFASDDPSLGSGDSTSTKTSGGGSSKTSTPSSSGSGSSSTPQGSSVSSDLPPEAKLSKDFPSDRVPLPSGSRVTSASSFGGGGSKTYSVEVYVKEAADKLAEYFNTELPKHGWTSGFTSDSNGEFLSTFTKTDASATSNEGVTISVADSETAGYAKATILVTTIGA